MSEINKEIAEIVGVQAKCIDKYLEIYPGAHLTDNGERSVMRLAIEQVKKGLNRKYHFLEKTTKSVLNVWIDRANTIRARLAAPAYSVEETSR